MRKTSLVIFMATIMAVGILGTSFTPDAQALKGKGVGVSQFGSSTDICGLVLCSEYPGGKEAYQTNWVSSFMSSSYVSADMDSDDHSDAHDASTIVPSAENVDEEFPAQLDEVIHKFELDKISAEDAIDGIRQVHDAYVSAKITNEIISGVGEKLELYDNGVLSAADAVESIHLTAEPQNVNPEYQGALDEVIHKFELDKISAEQAIDGIKQVHDGFVGLYITSNLIEAVNEKIVLIDSGKLSGADAVESIHLSAEPQNVDPEFAGALDEVIHKFELDKISAEDAMTGIIEVHSGMVALYITSDIIKGVEEKIALYESGKLAAADAVESVHLTAEPQNVDPEFIGALDEYLHKFELGKLSADETITGVIDVYDGLTSLYISSELVDAVGIQINNYESDNDSVENILHEIHEEIEKVEAKMAELESVDDEMHAKELPPNTVDMPVGAGVPGCETNDTCYTPTHLTVSAGTTVTWINSDGSIPHTVTAGWPDSDSIGLDYPGGNGFDSDFMSGGATFEHTFEVPGEYDYYCQLHPWMTGSVTVE